MDTVQPNCLVTIRYVLKAEIAPGEFKERPETEMTFVFGVEEQVPTLEAGLRGKAAGDRFSASIPASEIYGEHDPGLIREIPKEGLIQQRLREGRFYRQIKMGSLVSFKVLEVRPDTVLVDFNEPMAGISARVEGVVTAVRPATEAEIAEAQENHRRRKIGCG